MELRERWAETENVEAAEGEEGEKEIENRKTITIFLTIQFHVAIPRRVYNFSDPHMLWYRVQYLYSPRLCDESETD